MLTPAQYVALKNELTGAGSDPANLGYATYVTSGNDAALRLMLNHLRDGSSVPQMEIAGSMTNLGNPGAAISVRRPDITPAELIDVIDNRDLGTGTQNTNALWGALLRTILGQSRIRLANADGTLTRTRQNLNRMIGNTNNSQDRFDALAVRTGSRAEVLFGTGTVVDDADIARALRATP